MYGIDKGARDFDSSCQFNSLVTFCVQKLNNERKICSMQEGFMQHCSDHMYLDS